VNNKKSTLLIKVEIKSDEAILLLGSQAKVEFEAIDSFTLLLDIGSGAVQKKISLPVPLVNAMVKKRIARKSCWAEYSAPVAKQMTSVLVPTWCSQCV
jgi:hypothetical protein